MKKLLLLLLLPLYGWTQTTDANLKALQIDPKIRNITTASGITKGNVSDVLQAIVDSKHSRIEANTTSGTNTYTTSISWVTGYSFGLNFEIVFNSGNTGAATININTLGAINLKKNGSTALISGDIASGQAVTLFYDGTNFQVLGIGGGGSTVIPAALTKVDDTNVTLTLGGTPTTALLQAVSLTMGWAGTLADGRIASASNWNTAYNRSPTSLGFTSSTFTLTKQDATTLTVSVPTFNQNTTGTALNLSGTQTQNTVYAAPSASSGAASFRFLTTSDLPFGVIVRDVNNNIQVNNPFEGGATITTAAGTTTLTVASAPQEFFVGSTTQTVLLPVVSGIPLYAKYYIINLSSGNVTVQSSGGNTIQVMTTNTYLTVSCISNSGTTAASWSAIYQPIVSGGGTVTSVGLSVPSFLSVSGSPITSSGTLAVSLSGTALPVANGGTGITSFGTGVATALGVNVGSAGAFIVNGGALGIPSSGTATNITGLPISTGLTGGNTNSVPYFTSSTALSTSATFLFDGTNLGIGATPQSVLTASKQTTIQAPVSGSVAQFIGLDASPLRLTFDTHNNANASGTALMFRRSRGTAGSPSALSTDDDMGSFNTRGYGTTGYAASSTGLLSFKANQTFTDTNMGTYAVIYTTPDNSVTAVERLRVAGSGILTASGYTTANGILYTNGSGVVSQATVGSLPGLGTGVGTWLTTPSSANLASALTDETGTLLAVFSNAPTFTNQVTITGSGAVPSLSISGAGSGTNYTYRTFQSGGSTETSSLKDNGLYNLTTAVQGSTIGGTWTAIATQQRNINFGGTFTNTGTISDVVRGASFSETLVAGANNQFLTTVKITPTFTNGAFTGVTNYALSVGATTDISPYFSVGPSTLPNGGTQYWLSVAGTLPTSPTAAVRGIFFDVTSAGSASQRPTAFRTNLEAGYTGSSGTLAGTFDNQAAGTNTTSPTMTTSVGNVGNLVISEATTTGHNYGTISQAYGGAKNFGVIGQTQTAKNSATNIAVIGLSNNTGTTPIVLGGFFGLIADVTMPTFATAALMADNGIVAADIFVARDNGTAIFTIPDGGGVSMNGNITLNTAGNKLFVTEGSNGSVGQTTLVSGTKAITVTGTTTSSRCIVTLVSQGGTVTTTVNYGCVCTANTVTITALTSAIATNTTDTSIINYWIVN